MCLRQTESLVRGPVEGPTQGHHQDVDDGDDNQNYDVKLKSQALAHCRG